MTLSSTDLSLPLASLALAVALGGCTPGSLKLGEDTETSGDTDTDSDTGTGTDTDPGDPPDGVDVWNQVLPDISANDLAIAPDGSFYVIGASGYTYEGGDGGFFANSWIGRFDPAGALLWQLAEPIGEGSSPYLIAADAGPGGELFVAVVDFNVLEGGGNEVRKLDPDGNEVWAATLPARAAAVTATADGGVIVGGGQSTGNNSGVAWAQGLSAAGGVLWERTWGDPQMRWSSVDALAADGDTIVLGGRLGVEPLSSRAQAWLSRVEATTGATVWERLLTDAATTDHVADLGLDGDGRIIAVGVESGIFVRAFDPDGGDLWGLTPEVSGRTIAVAPDGSFVLTDGKLLPEEDPEACLEPTGTCPVALRVVRQDADQTIRWQAQRDTCREGRVAGITPDDHVLVVAGCSAAPIDDVALGLFLFAP